MSDLMDWYNSRKKENFNSEVIQKSTSDPVILIPTSSDDKLGKRRDFDDKEEYFKKINALLDRNKKPEEKVNAIKLETPNGEVENVQVVKKVEVVEPKVDLVKPSNDAEKIEKETILDRETVENPDKDYVEKRDDILVDRLTAVNVAMGNLINRLSIYSNYLKEPLQYMERKSVLEQIQKLQLKFGTILTEINNMWGINDRADRIIYFEWTQGVQ